MEKELVLSVLGHTWILDLDGTVLKHNGHKTEEGDNFLEGALSFLQGLPSKDMVIFLTSRTEEYRSSTEAFLKKHGIRYEGIVFGVPYGERILVNDNKPGGLRTSIGICTTRDQWCGLTVREDAAV